MKTIILKPKEESQSKLVMSLMKELKIPARFMTEEEVEDAYLARMIDEGMKEKGEVPLEQIRKKLRK